MTTGGKRGRTQDNPNASRVNRPRLDNGEAKVGELADKSPHSVGSPQSHHKRGDPSKEELDKVQDEDAQGIQLIPVNQDSQQTGESDSTSNSFRSTLEFWTHIENEKLKTPKELEDYEAYFDAMIKLIPRVPEDVKEAVAEFKSAKTSYIDDARKARALTVPPTCVAFQVQEVASKTPAPSIFDDEIAELRAQLAQKDAQLAQKDAQLAVERFVAATSKKLEKIHSQLLLLSGLGQEDKTTVRSCTPSALAENEAMKKKEESHENHEPTEPARLDNTEEFRKLQSLDMLEVSLQDVEDKALRTFNKSFQEAAKKAEIICQGDDKEGFTTEMQSQLEQALLSDSESAVSIPGPRAAEVSCTQPYLDKLLRCLGICVEVDSQQHVHSPDKETVRPPQKEVVHSKVYSPPKSFFLVDRLVPRVGGRKKRVVDRSVVPLRRYQFACREPVVEGWIEDKRGERTGQKPRDLLGEGISQICGHCAKYVGIGFNFGGCGVSSFATGLVLTPAYVVVVRLELENMGTPEAKLEVKQSRILPLFTQANFEKWYHKGKSEYESEWQAIGTEMYSNDPGDVPAGLRFLWKFVGDRREGHYGPRLTYNSDKVGDLLGYGAFSTVHILKGPDDCVCKISRFGSIKEIQNEERILRPLKHAHIPRARSLEKTKVNVGNHEIEVPTLILSPRGESVEKMLATRQFADADKMLKKIGDHIKSALDYLHTRSERIFHCDVSTKNIIFANGNACLIDFGISKKDGKMQCGFQGTIAFAHRSIFTKYPGKEWKPTKQHDISSLGLTMAALKYISSTVERRLGRIPWGVPATAELTTSEIQEYHEQRLKCVAEIVRNGEQEWQSWAKQDPPQ